MFRLGPTPIVAFALGTPDQPDVVKDILTAGALRAVADIAARRIDEAERKQTGTTDRLRLEDYFSDRFQQERHWRMAYSVVRGQQMQPAQTDTPYPSRASLRSHCGTCSLAAMILNNILATPHRP